MFGVINFITFDTYLNYLIMNSRNYVNGFLIIFFILIFISCTKEKDTPVPVKPTSTCPTGYTGTNCGTQITPSKIRINKITITRFPQYDGGSNWDVLDIGDSRPDVYVTLSLNSTVLLTSNYYQDANYYQDYDFSNSPTFPFDIVLPNTQFTIRAWDYDTGADDYIGGINFTPYSSTGGFPSIINIDGGGAVSFQLHVTYFY